MLGARRERRRAPLQKGVATGGVATVSRTWALGHSTLLAAGSYTVDLRVRYLSGSTGNVGGGAGATRQGRLSILLLKP